MNWLIFAIAAYLFSALEHGLRGLLVIPGPATGVSPSFLLILMVFIGLQAQSMTVAWASLILGLLVDLQPGPDGLTIPGPAALGYLLGGYAVVQLRSLLFRDSTLTLAIMVFTVGIFTNLAEVAIYSFRQLDLFAADTINGWSPAEELVRRFLELIYTSIVALPLGYLLMRTSAVWSFVRFERSY